MSWCRRQNSLGESTLFVGADSFDQRCRAFTPVDVDGPGIQVGVVALEPKSRLGRSERCTQVPGQRVQVSQLHAALLVLYSLT